MRWTALRRWARWHGLSTEVFFYILFLVIYLPTVKFFRHDVNGNIVREESVEVESIYYVTLQESLGERRDAETS